MRRSLERRKALAGSFGGPEDEGRVERDRRERIGRHADEIIAAHRRDDRNAGSELAEAASERRRISTRIAGFDRGVGRGSLHILHSTLKNDGVGAWTSSDHAAW